MAKKYDNTSLKYSDWTTKHLKEMAISYDELINGEFPCYNTRDIITLDNIMLELDKRGITPNRKLSFNN